MRNFNLFAALAASITAHALLILWPFPLATASARTPAKEFPASRLRVILAALPEASVPAALPQEQAPPAIEAQPQTIRAPAETESGAREQFMPSPDYFPVSALTRMPEPAGRFDVQMPAAGDTGIGGKVTIRLWIGASGGVDRMSVRASDLPAAFEEAALEAFRKLKFTPGEINAKPVRTWVDIVIEYAQFRDPPIPPAAAPR